MLEVRKSRILRTIPLLIRVSQLIHKFPKKSVTNGGGHGLVYIES